MNHREGMNTADIVGLSFHC